MAVAGLLADARQISEIARQEAASYRSTYGGPIPCHVLADRVAMYMHAYTLYSFMRPFGCSVILSSYDDDGPHMYSIEPSGVCHGYFGCTVGKGKQAAKTEIEKIKMKDMNLRQLVDEVSRIIYTVHDEVKDKAFELELSWVGKDTEGRHKFVPAEIQQAAETSAKTAIADSDSDEEM
jgi:20S proteasome subunit alpha 7